MIRALLAFLFAATLAQAGAAQTSQLKGWTTVTRELSTRIAPPYSPLDMDQFLPAEDIDVLLGTWNRFGDEHTFQNGAPNSVNMMIWRVALSGFAKGIAASCTAPRLELHERFLSTLKRLCAWPAPEAKSDAVLTAFWFSMMGYSAPESEFAAWRKFFLASSYKDKPAAETIEAMTFAITMNPYFLMER